MAASQTVPDKALQSDSSGDAKWMRFAIALLIAFGVGARVTQYVHNLAPAPDEGYLGHHLIDKTSAQLFGPLGDSLAPGGFMVLAQLCIHALGVNEYALRFVSILGGIAALLLFYPVARRLSTPFGALMGLALLAVSGEHIFFSAFFRPYAFETALALLIVTVALWAVREGGAPLRLVCLAFLASVSVWMSYACVFVIAGVGTAQCMNALFRKQTSMAISLLVAYGVSALSFGCFYLVSVYPTRNDPETMGLLGSYMNLGGVVPYAALPAIKWMKWQSINVFENPCGLTLPELGAFAASLGVWSLFRRDKLKLGIVVLPIVFALIGSALHMYPFWRRTILYLSPFLFVLIGEGIAYLYSNLATAAKPAAILLFVLLAAVPASRVARLLIKPASHHELNSALDYAQQHWQEGDVLFLGRRPVKYCFAFARHRFTFAPDRILSMTDDRSYRGLTDPPLNDADIERLRRTKRVWIPLIYDDRSVFDPYVAALDKCGTRLSEFDVNGACVMAYRFP